MIKKSLLIFMGFVLILLLASLTFSNVSEPIREDLLKKANLKLYEKGMNDINVELQGEGVTLSRTLILRGAVYSETQKAYIASLFERVDGVSSIDNQIVVTSPNYYQPIPDENGEVAGIPPLKLLSPKNIEKPIRKPIEKPTLEMKQVHVDVDKREVNTNQKSLEAQEVIQVPEVIAVPSSAFSSRVPSELPKVLTPIDASAIEVISPISSTVEIPQVTEVISVSEVDQIVKKGEN